MPLAASGFQRFNGTGKKNMAGFENLSDGFHTKPLEDGNIEFRFVSGPQQIVGRCTPAELGIIATNLLNSAIGAFNISGKPAPAQKLHFNGPVINVSRWAVGDTPTQNQKVVIFECGEAQLAAVVGQDKVRNLAQYLVEASYNASSTAPVSIMFRELFRLLKTGLVGCVVVSFSRLKRSSRRGANWIWSHLSGRSLLIISSIKISKGFPAPKYNPIRSCVYCGTTVYSTKPNVRTLPLGLEHIIAEGIGGTMELPEASCQECEDATGRLVEGQVLGNTLKALRVHLNLKKPGSGRHPSTLPISAKVDGADRIVQIPVEDYPIIFNMLVYPPPDVVNVNTEQGRLVIGMKFAQLRFDQKELYRKYKISGFSSAIWDNQMLTRMLAKIAHSFAFAELGGDKFKPRLVNLITRGDISAMNLVGGDDGLNDGERPSTALHELALGYQRINEKVFVVARIRLFASSGGPFYSVIVGDSLETSLTRLARISKYVFRLSWSKAP
jgi:hypothetical protein